MRKAQGQDQSALAPPAHMPVLDKARESSQRHDGGNTLWVEAGRKGQLGKEGSKPERRPPTAAQEGAEAGAGGGGKGGASNTNLDARRADKNE